MSDLESDYDETHEYLADANQRIAELEKLLADCDSQWQHAVSENMQLEAEVERLKNGECLVKLHNALLAEGEKAKALLQQTEELKAENERLRNKIMELQEELREAINAAAWESE